MKRFLCAALALVMCLVLPAACGDKRELSGTIVEVCPGEEGSPASFVLETDNGREVGVLVSEDTYFWSWLDGVDMDAFRVEPQLGSALSITWEGSRQSMTTGGGKTVAAYRAADVYLRGLLTPGAVTLADGTPVDRMDVTGAVRYQLADGTELLVDDKASGPDGVHAGGLAGFDDLNGTAQERVMAYYRERGLLYDPLAELERAYAAYLAAPEDFLSPYMAGQRIYPSGATERVLYFITSVTLPVQGGVCYERRLSDAFDRQTGEHIDAWDLFTCSPEEAKTAILDLAALQDDALRREMEEAFRSENLVFYGDSLEVWFPQGSLPSQEYTTGFYLDYSEPLAAILQPWAITAREMEQP